MATRACLHELSVEAERLSVTKNLMLSGAMRRTAIAAERGMNAATLTHYYYAADG